MAESDSLSANQKKALVALLACPSVAAAAKQAGLGERTLYRYLADDTFKAELRARQDQAIAAATAALSGLTGTAIETLRKVLTDPDASHAVKVRAALGILRERRRIGELDDLAERVSRLEEVLGERYKATTT